MKIKLTLAMAALVALMSTSCQSGGGKSPKLTSEVDSVSYALGILIGQQNKQGLEGFPGGTDMDVNIMAASFRQFMNNESTLMTAGEANEVVGNFFENRNNLEAQGNLEKGNAFLESNRNRSGVVTTESGLQYEVISQGSGPIPGPTDVVRVHYHGTLVDGRVFDSSLERGEPVEFPVNQVIPGWVEALQLMPVGSKWNLYLPGDLAYGPSGAGGDIGPNEVLIFEVELIDIVNQ